MSKDESESQGHEVPEISEKQLVLLGLVAEEPIHAYGLEEKIRERNMAQWTEIGFSSIYRVLGQLQDRGLIDARLEHEGQGATRKVHSLTETGMAALSAGVLARVESVGPLKNPFQIALAYLVHAPYDEALAGLEKRRAGITEAAEMVTAIAAHHRSGPFPDEAPRRTRRRQTSVHLLFDHMRHHLEAERASIAAALAYLQAEGRQAFDEAEETR